jgi:hypothetical protein
MFVTCHKDKHDGTYERTKSRVTPNGAQQISGVDYYPEEVSYATVGVDTLALVNNISVSRGARGMEEWVVDVTSAFSSQPLRSPRDVFIKWPRNYEQDNPGKVPPGTVLRLLNSFAGLKQSGHTWYRKVVTVMKANNMSQCSYDPCLWFSDTNGMSLICVATDDFRITTDTKEDQRRIVKFLSDAFGGGIREMPLEMFHGLKYEHDRDAPGGPTISTSQETFIDQLLEDYGMTDCKPAYTPMASGTKLEKPQQPDEEARKFPLSELIGSVRWAARCTFWETNGTITRINEHVHDPSAPVIAAAKRLLRYLKGRKSFRLVYRASNLNVCGTSDADYNGEPSENRNGGRSISGNIIYCEGGGIICTSALPLLGILCFTFISFMYEI